MELGELQAYGFFALTIFLVIVLYGYIFHLYTKREDVDGHDYEEYSNLALNDDIGDAPVSPVSDTKEK